MNAAYTVRRAVVTPELLGLWDGPVWHAAPPLAVASFHARSSDHRPRVEAKLLYDLTCLYAFYRVDDRFVRSVHTEYESDTYKDSCVELFVQPRPDRGYFALEANCGGAFSLRYIEDPTRTAHRFAKWTEVEWALAATIRIAHSLPPVVDPEVRDPVSWWVEMAWPLDVLDAYCGPVRPLAGTAWRANCFKCGDGTSHPHWASWAPIGETLNFHQPQYFGVFEFSE